MSQYIIVIAILTATAVLAVRWVVRTLRGKGGCGCSSCEHCPMKGDAKCHCHDQDLHLPDIKV
ncbi:MAG: FeoB-associated Cys-rich membrane protein [Bacteroidales bacterium]|nr:FeoB-associated Cys-rich membrane protein [Bacteroidales bacterium]